MAFKKLHSGLLESIEQAGFVDPLPYQKELISLIKSGVNVYAFGPEGVGRSTAIVLSTLHKLNFEAFDDPPRAIIIVKDKEAALEMEANFARFTRYSDIRVKSVYEEGKVELQREEIYVGVDVVIITPKRLHKIYFLNGINLNKIQLFIIEDAQFLAKENLNPEIVRISQSTAKCQYIICAEKREKVFEKFDVSFMEKCRVLKP